MELSVIIPKYNNAALAGQSIRDLIQYLSGWCSSYEIIVVDDGSRMEERLREGQIPTGVRVIQLEQNRGKGAAVKVGMLEACGEVRAFTDMDLPFDLSAIRYAYDLIKTSHFHFIAGDRTLPQSTRLTKVPLVRKITSRIFTRLISFTVIGGNFDFQCGFKAFSASLTKLLFPLLTIDHFNFDVEIYYILLKYNILIRRIPVKLTNHQVSTVSLLKHALPMWTSSMRIPFNWHRGRYHSQELKVFLDQPYWQ